MKDGGVTEFFESYLKQGSLFLDKSALQSNYFPDKIFHRDEQINQLAKILAPALRGERTSNIFIYGKTGTGKTLTTTHTTAKLAEVARSRGVPLKVVYVNCKLKKVADTEYRLMAQLCKEFGREVPVTGLPTDEIYSIFYKIIESEKQTILLVLDEIDQLVEKSGNSLLYNITRINSELKNASLSIIGISNSVVFTEQLDPRVKSSLSEEALVFPPYNALQIQTILKQRTEQAFKQGAVDEGVVEKCSAFAAREHGDARKAVELMRVAGELAERECSSKILMRHIDSAQEKIEKDMIQELVSLQPKQHQAVLYAAILVSEKRKEQIYTGEICEAYNSICSQTGLRPLTQRRVSDIIAEFDMLGILSAKVISKGRYGRTREISVGIPGGSQEKVKKILQEGLGMR